MPSVCESRREGLNAYLISFVLYCAFCGDIERDVLFLREDNDILIHGVSPSKLIKDIRIIARHISDDQIAGENGIDNGIGYAPRV